MAGAAVKLMGEWRRSGVVRPMGQRSIVVRRRVGSSLANRSVAASLGESVRSDVVALRTELFPMRREYQSLVESILYKSGALIRDHSEAGLAPVSCHAEVRAQCEAMKEALRSCERFHGPEALSQLQSECEGDWHTLGTMQDMARAIDTELAAYEDAIRRVRSSTSYRAAGLRVARAAELRKSLEAAQARRGTLKTTWQELIDLNRQAQMSLSEQLQKALACNAAVTQHLIAVRDAHICELQALAQSEERGRAPHVGFCCC